MDGGRREVALLKAWPGVWGFLEQCNYSSSIFISPWLLSV